jgi:hypothetical protein
MEGWGNAWPDAGIGIVCGRVSSLAVLDEDPRHGGDASLAQYPLPRGPIVLSGGGGRHFYFALNGEVVPKVASLLPGVDLLGEGALATAPPSVHPNGTAYKWEPGRELGTLPLPAMPFWLRRLLRDHRQQRVSAGAYGPSPGVPIEIAAVLGQLRGVRHAPGGWTACCPAHADAAPSLSIGLGERGRVLLHCFAGCSYPAIRAALD